MRIKLATLKGKLIGGALVGMTALATMNPMTVFAGGVEEECICEEKCTEDHINEDCPICNYDWKQCEGKEAEEEKEGPLTPDGNMNLVDDYDSLEEGGKQFITVTSKNGNYFYIIIDRDDNGNQTVHFLNLVDESDLLSLMDEDQVKKYIDVTGLAETGKEEAETVAEEPTKEPEPEPVTEEPEVKEEEKKDKRKEADLCQRL